MSPAQERERAIQIVKTDFPTALQRARAVSDAWYRAQALAWVARFAPEAEVASVAREALIAASAGKDQYQQVASAAWAVRALVERERADLAAKAVLGLLCLSAEITQPLSRLQALFLLWQAAWGIPRTIHQQVLHRLETACRSSVSWRAGRTLGNVVLILAREEPDDAQRMLQLMPEGRYRRQTQRRFDAGETVDCRSFFW